MNEAAEIDQFAEGRTVTTEFRDRVAADPDRPALRWRIGETEWGEITFAQWADQSCRIAAAMQRLGVQHGDRIVLMMRNRPETAIADMAALLVGATPISIYNSSAAEQLQFLLNHSEAKYAVVEDMGFLERILAVRDEVPDLKGIAIIDDPDGAAPDDVISWDALLADEPLDLATAAATAEPDELATIIYTSGTTGPPKGVMLDHHNIVWTVESLRRCFPVSFAGARVVSYLPMAHIAERVVSYYQGIMHGLAITWCPETSMVTQYLGAVRPELFFAVPRVWEKAYATITALARADVAAAEKFDAALALGWKASEYRAREEALPADLAAEFETADAEVLGVWRALVGLDECLLAVSGAAPLPVEIFKFFRSLGVPLAEVYGLSETSGPLTLAPVKVKAGSVGPAIPGCEVVLGDDGEVLGRGGNIFRGYFKADEKTAEVLDDDGWFHTGDIGEFDADGYLRIVDRKKELIITAGGKNISPANIEASLKGHPLIAQACVIGDGKPFVSALIVLDGEVAPAWAMMRGIEFSSIEDLAAKPELLAEIQASVDATNAHFSQAERIKRYTLLTAEWMPDSEMLTPTMKLKRRGVHARFAAEIEAMYH